MRAEIFTIGDELCRGEIVDTNSSWMADRLWEMGVTVHWMTSCRDVREDMIRAFREAAERADLILVSGGLGPTEDDLTVDVVCEIVGAEAVTHEPSLLRMKDRFERAGYQLTPNNLRQVRVPASARALMNPAGQAPGFEVALGQATMFVMPGVPREMQAIFDAYVVERVTALAASSEKIRKRVYRVFGKGESHIDHALAGLGGADATLHYQVAFPETLVKVVVRDRDAAAAEARLAELDREVRARLGIMIYGEGKDSLATVLGRALAAAGRTLAVAESCTGGMLGSLITDVPGSSRYFVGGYIVYADEAKRRELGVRADTLARLGAVSRECVEEMAAGARARAGADFAAAISGIAGPDGGTPDKPVGTVHIAVMGPGGTAHKQMLFPGARDQIRRLACYWAMALLLREVGAS
ncbi:MAG TPA: competence/damage-inducible protein A [Haliangiales bacterium]|nr:competence/damage-inducible protein A [Haliangiales bacterium]